MPGTSQVLPSLLPLARVLARGLARTPTDVDDLVQEALFAVHEALRRTPHPRCLEAFARHVMQRAMWRFYDRRYIGDAWQANVDPLDKVQGVGYSTWIEEQVSLDDYFVALERKYGSLVRRVAEQLFAPSGPTAAYILAEIQPGANRQKHGLPPRRQQVRNVRLSRRQVRRSLNISPKRWRLVITQVETFTRDWALQSA